MFGILAFGDRQYKIVPGEFCAFEKIEGKEGDKVELKGLVFLADDDCVILENERLKRYVVNCEIGKQYRENKVIAFKKHRRKDYTRKKGHRQYKTLIKIESIELKG